MRATLLALILLMGATARAQSTWNFTLFNDPALPCPTFCQSEVGSGMFTVSQTPNAPNIISGSLTTYSITSLYGNLNGQNVSLAPVPSGLGNVTLGYLLVPWFAPWYVQTSQGVSMIGQLDITHPGTGQYLTDPTGKITYVSFTATLAPVPVPPTPKAPPIPTFSGRPPVLSSGLPGQLPFRATTPAPARRSMQPIVISIDVAAAVAVGVSVYELMKHHHQRRDAYPSGRASL